ncbi:MAG: outer membrane beta-barrel protein [Hyphomicrobium sp.]|nr:outer membrane beta-barrel protein [Hyphomicrobium sp.]
MTGSIGGRLAAGSVARSLIAVLGITLAPSASSADTWTDGYFGISVGADLLTGDATISQSQADFFSVFEGEADVSTPIGGNIGVSLTAGADYQINQLFVVGAFVSYDWSNIENGVDISADTGDTAFLDLVDVRSVWTVAARAGVLVSPTTLFYGLAGYSWLDVDDLEAGINSAFLTQNFKIDLPSSEGLTVGGGVEYKLGSRVSLRAEYRYTNFGRETLAEMPGLGLTATGEAESHSARIGAFYRLGVDDNETSDSETVTDPAKRWRGVHAGFGIGLDAYDRELDASAEVFGFGADASAEGIGGGNMTATVLGGYDIPLTSHIVAGVLASADWSATESSLDMSVALTEIDTLTGAPIQVDGGRVSAELLNLDYSWTIGGRLGYAAGSDLLVYGLLGYTRAQFKDISFGVDGCTCLAFDMPSLDGVTVGGGFEKFLTDRISLKAEYRYTDLEAFGETLDLDLFGFGYEIDTDIHAAKLLLNYRFGGP